jgi:tRNA nucleotidyltransferase (CCA-adding enzyme)
MLQVGGDKMNEIDTKIPDFITSAIEKIENAGFECFLVGGCVRDMILSRIPNDWDLITNAKIPKIRRLFPKYAEFGAKYGSITVFEDDKKIEITTYRVDGKYIDGRRPDSVDFTNDINEDLIRRDFTINALAYNRKKRIVDNFGGISDIKSKIIKCIGDPDTKFEEDYLRMLRALRFACQLGFDISPETANSIKNHAQLVAKINLNLVRQEFDKALLSDFPERIEYFSKTDVDKFLLPGLAECFDMPQTSKFHLYSVGKHTMEALKNTESNLVLRLAALFHDFGKVEVVTFDDHGQNHFKGHEIASIKIANSVMGKLGYGAKICRKVTKLIEFHDITLNPKNLPRLAHIVHLVGGSSMFRELLKLQRADTMAKNPEYSQAKLNMIAETEKLLNSGVLSGQSSQKS